MGCAPSKQNAEFDTDPEKRPKSPKSRKSPKKDRADKKDKTDASDKGEGEQLSNNNANKDGDGPIVEERVVATQSAPESAAPPGEQNGSAPVDSDVHQDNFVETRSAPGSPYQEIPAKYGEIWDMTKGMPPPTSPYDDDDSPPPKPERSFNLEEGVSQGRSFHTFPRSRQRQRPQSAREQYLDESKKGATIERKQSLRERTPQRRKDLDLSGNIYMGKTIDPPGRGRKVDMDALDFLHAETTEANPEDKEVGSPRTNVKELASAYLEQVKKKDEDNKPKSPIQRPVRKILEDDSDSDQKDVSVLDGNTSIIEVVNKEILDDYHEVPKKTFEEIEAERIQREAEEAELERIRLEEEERIRAEEAEAERLRLEEEARIRAEEEEKERIRLEEEERVRAEEERIRAEEERIRAEEEAQLELERLREEEARLRLEEESQPLIEAIEEVQTEQAAGDRLDDLIEDVKAEIHEGKINNVLMLHINYSTKESYILVCLKISRFVLGPIIYLVWKYACINYAFIKPQARHIY